MLLSVFGLGDGGGGGSGALCVGGDPGGAEGPGNGFLNILVLFGHRVCSCVDEACRARGLALCRPRSHCLSPILNFTPPQMQISVK
jgi:hypothetical protein